MADDSRLENSRIPKQTGSAGNAVYPFYILELLTREHILDVMIQEQPPDTTAAAVRNKRAKNKRKT